MSYSAIFINLLITVFIKTKIKNYKNTKVNNKLKIIQYGYKDRQSHQY